MSTNTSAAQDLLWRAVADADENAAIAVLYHAMDEGLDEETLLLDVIAPVQERVGVEWAADRITVAQEHAATAINERAMAALAHRRSTRPPRSARRGRITVACIDGEWHSFPARLISETLRLRGWHVDHLGAQTPTPHLVAHLHRTGSDAVLLSSSLPTRLPTAHAAITACQAIGVPVMVGGRAFGPGGRYAHALGADQWAPDARTAATVLEAGLDRPVPAAMRLTIDDLPHLDDQEYTLVIQNRAQLIKQTLAELEGLFPAMRTYSTAQRDRTTEDLAHIVDFLATALYVDDAELFTTFTAWTAGILTARNVPIAGLRLGLDVLTGQLRDFPRALTFLTAATDALHTTSDHTGPGITA
ncbi:B12-binding domain-containing protein [Streptomyces sp. NPDC093071]|uniref:cobalamin B12-binding domain-containing protein n=1 Tax=Streptomyces sp. NPDC093071 TaxID=3366022 RepID=UPI0038163B81